MLAKTYTLKSQMAYAHYTVYECMCYNEAVSLDFEIDVISIHTYVCKSTKRRKKEHPGTNSMQKQLN